MVDRQVSIPLLVAIGVHSRILSHRSQSGVKRVVWHNLQFLILQQHRSTSNFHLDCRSEHAMLGNALYRLLSTHEQSKQLGGMMADSFA